MKKDIKLSRIHCVGCAMNLEDKIREVDGVLKASIDFSSKVVSLEVENKNAKEIVERVQNTITSFDSSIKIVDTTQEEKQAKKEKIEKILSICKIILSVLLTVVAFVLPTSVRWLQVLLYVLAYLSVGAEVLYTAVKNILKGKVFDENFLMSIATIGALVLQEFVEAVAVMLLYSIGEAIEAFAVEKSRKRVKSLLNIKAEYAYLVDGESELQVDVSNVSVGQIIRIKPGNKVPLDCKIISGYSSFNTSAVTGESKEMFASVGDEVLSGFINCDGVVECKVLKTEKESTVTKIIDLVENATKTKAKSERFISRFAKWYTPVVVGIAVLLFAIPSLMGLGVGKWLHKALTFLVVSCPCALVISVPLSFYAGIGASARNGILVKGASFLEELAKVNNVAFDKTGTLTVGNFVVSKIYAEPISSEEEVLELIAYAECFSNHRIAKSIVSKYGKQINTAWVQEYKEIAGKGVEVNLFGEPCLVGNAELMYENKIKFQEIFEGLTAVYIAKSGEYLGYILIEDEIRPESYEAISELKKYGLSISMYTGDNASIAERVAGKLRLDDYYASLLPDKKLEKVKALQESGNKIAFVGDGINDAPAISQADVGISMGGVGSDSAIEASDVVIMTDQTTKVAEAIKIAKKTRAIVFENITFILIVKVAVMVLTTFLAPQMWLAIFADVGLAVLAVLNSLRAMIVKKKKKDKNPS